MTTLRNTTLVLAFLALVYAEYRRWGRVTYEHRNGTVYSITVPRHLWQMNREKYLDENPTIQEIHFSD